MYQGKINEEDMAKSALNAVPTPGDRPTWLNITMSYKAWTKGEGYEEWDSWSRRGENYNEQENRQTWDSIRADCGGTGAGTLYRLAINAGWQDPRKAQERPAKAFCDLHYCAWKHDYGEIMQEATREENVRKAVEYAAQRGLNEETAKAWGLGYIGDYHFNKAGEGRLIIPYPEARYYRARRTEEGASPKYLCPKSDNVADKGTGSKWGGKPLFNPAALRQSESPVYVLEGEIDCITLEQAGRRAVATNEGQLAEAITPEVKARKYIVVPDNDEAGRRKAAKRVDELKRKHRSVIVCELPPGVKDVNQLWTSAPQELEAWCEDAERALDREIAGQEKEILAATGLDEFMKAIMVKGANRPVPTGFPLLDSAPYLDGGLHAGLYVVGAISSLGKTTFVMQIADQIAASGHDVMVFSLEMGRDDLIGKSVSRYTVTRDCRVYQSRTAADMNGVSVRKITCNDSWCNMSEERRHKVLQAMADYRNEVGQNLAIIESVRGMCVEQIRENVERHIDLGRGRPVVIIDYLQIIAPQAEHRRDFPTDKQLVDHNVGELKYMSRDFHIPVVAISSLNRAGYSGKISMEAMKESGAVEYSSDVLLGLQLKGAGSPGFDVNLAKGKNPREIQLVCLKQRNGATGWTLDYQYYPCFNKFLEVVPFP